MLFKKESYELIGGHEGTFDEVVEDIALAKKIKNRNLKYDFLIQLKLYSVYLGTIEPSNL